MFRTLIWFTYFWLYQLSILPALFKANRYAVENKTAQLDELSNRIAGPWALSLLKLAGCTVTVKGIENIPVNSPVLYVANHQSNFDIPILMAHIPYPKGFVAKESLEKLPLISQWMRHIHCVFIKRGSPRDAAAAINQGIALLKQGYSMVVFPEGTRSKDGNLQEFKPGALKLATKAAVPMVPVAISGSINMMKKGSLIIHPAAVTVTISPPVPTESYAHTDTVVLCDTVKQTIAGHMAAAKEKE